LPSSVQSSRSSRSPRPAHRLAARVIVNAIEGLTHRLVLRPADASPEAMPQRSQRWCVATSCRSCLNAMRLAPNGRRMRSRRRLPGRWLHPSSRSGPVGSRRTRRPRATSRRRTRHRRLRGRAQTGCWAAARRQRIEHKHERAPVTTARMPLPSRSPLQIRYAPAISADAATANRAIERPIMLTRGTRSAARNGFGIGRSYPAVDTPPQLATRTHRAIQHDTRYRSQLGAPVIARHASD
jgi:hypothetical protein